MKSGSIVNIFRESLANQGAELTEQHVLAMLKDVENRRVTVNWKTAARDKTITIPDFLKSLTDACRPQ
jgi:hypothetical protein